MNKLILKNIMQAYWPILAGILLIACPTFYTLSKGLWTVDSQSHGPIVLLMTLWFFYFKLKNINTAPKASFNLAAYVLLFLATTLYALGRSQELATVEVASIDLILFALSIILLGTSITRKLWFAFFFSLFMIPLPGSLVDIITLPMKIGVSWATDELLYMLGYPVSRDGVVLNIGQYRLMVADACAGLNSLFTLEGLGLFYINVIGHESIRRNLALGLMIVPISFTSNIIRVVLLALITYYWGDEVGQGFVHEFSGMVLFMTALVLIISLDSFIEFVLKRRKKAAHA